MMKRSRHVPVCAKPGCTRQVFVDHKTGIQHDYCGRTHALEHLDGDVDEPHGICHVCKLPGCNETVYFDEDSGRVHDFCCWSHAEQAMETGIWPRSLKGIQVCGGDASTVCSLPGCSAPRFRDLKTGEVFDYCGRTHAFKAKERGLVGRSNALTDKVDRVWPTKFNGEEGTVSLMMKSHEKYEAIKRQFINAWRHPGKKVPTVQRIYQVRNTPSTYNRYLSYRDEIEEDPDSALMSNKAPGNELRRFHGTNLHKDCSFGVVLNAAPCPHRSCPVCSICRGGFDLTYAGSGTGGRAMSLRFGRGLYFSSTSSKSDDYAVDSERPYASGSGALRCMFLCKVAAGEAFLARENMSQAQVDAVLAGGFASIVGQPCDSGEQSPPLPGSGAAALNYDELVVYKDAAAIPSYLIVYRL